MATSKIILAGILGAGLTISTIAFTGSGTIDNVKGNIDSLKTDLTEAIEDNTFLQTSFKNMKESFTGTLEEANNRIEMLSGDRLEYLEKIEELKSQLAATGEGQEEGQAEAQKEIDRLVGELEKANKEIAELGEYAAAADEAANYEPIDKKDFEVEEAAISNPVYAPITEKALQTDKANAEFLASYLPVTAIVGEYHEKGINVDILEVSTYNAGKSDRLAYVMTGDTEALKASPNNTVIKSYIGKIQGTFMFSLIDEAGNEIAVMKNY